MDKGQIVESGDFALLQQRLPLHQLINSGKGANLSRLTELQPKAVQFARESLQEQRKHYEALSNQKLNKQLQALEELRSRHLGQMELDIGNLLETVKLRRREERAAQINRLFDDYLDWLENTQITEDKPYLQVAAVFTGSEAPG